MLKELLNTEEKTEANAEKAESDNANAEHANTNSNTNTNAKTNSEDNSNKITDADMGRVRLLLGKKSLVCFLSLCFCVPFWRA